MDLATLRGQHPAAARAWRRARAARKDWLTRQAALKLPAGLERDADRALAAGDRHLRGGDAKAAERSYRSAETLLDQLQAGAQAGSAARDGADTAAKSYRSAPGPAHGDPDAATSLMSAAAADWQQGHVDKAADEYTRAAATYRTATTDLAEAQREWHAYSIALGAYWQEKREDWNLHAGSEQFDAGDAMHYKARGLLKDGKPAEAAAAFAEAARLVQDATERHRRARGQ